ncbi:MAG TPA: DEAD/DEAH box helicase family protein [Mycobacteriales bacterium]|nr:DEAD/DEAH box helicase family protein [Mycobacteriales bacterium]
MADSSGEDIQARSVDILPAEAPPARRGRVRKSPAPTPEETAPPAAAPVSNPTDSTAKVPTAPPPLTGPPPGSAPSAPLSEAASAGAARHNPDPFRTSAAATKPDAAPSPNQAEAAKPADVYPTETATPVEPPAPPVPPAPEQPAAPAAAAPPAPPPAPAAPAGPAAADASSTEAAGVRALQEAFAIDIAEREERHRAEVRAMQQSFMTDVAAREDRHRAEVQALHQRFTADAAAREDRQRAETSELQQLHGNLRAQLSEVTATRDRAQEAHATAEAELERLRDEIEVQRNDINRLNNARADLGSQLAASRQETEKWSEQARRVEVDLRTARADAEKAAAAAQKQYDEKVAELAETTRKLEETTQSLRSSEDRVARLTDQVAALEAASQQLRQTIAEQRAERERVTTERDSVRQQAAELEAQLRKTEFEAEQADEDGSRQLDEAARKIELAEENAARAIGQVAVHEATIEELRRAAADMAIELKKATVDRDAARRRMQSLEAEVALLQGEPEAAAEETKTEAAPVEVSAPEPSYAPEPVGDTGGSDDRPLALAEDIDLVAWQREALAAWRRAGHRGVVEAVSGAGKTALAHWAIAQAVDEGMKVLVITPTADQVDGWYDGLRAALPINRVAKQNGTREDHIGSADVVVTTASDAITNTIFGISDKVMVVADQVHHYGTREQSRALDPVYAWRLGLSAVYERDDSGIATYLDPYFGRVSYRLGFERALKDEAIAPFDVAVVAVSLNTGEQSEYDSLGQQMETLAAELVTDFGVPAEPAHEFATAVVALADGRMGPSRTAARAYQKALAKRDEIVSRAAGKAAVLKSLAEHIRSNDPALVFLQSSDDAAYVTKTFNTAGCATRPLSGGPERRLLGRRSDASQDASDVVLLAGAGDKAPSLGIIVGASRDKLQLIQRVGQVVRRNGEGHRGRIVTIHVDGVDAEGAGAPALDAITPHASQTRRFSASELVGLLDFLTGAEESADSDTEAE